jgi:hypothetical protein
MIKSNIDPYFGLLFWLIPLVHLIGSFLWFVFLVRLIGPSFWLVQLVCPFGSSHFVCFIVFICLLCLFWFFFCLLRGFVIESKVYSYFDSLFWFI